MMKKIVLLGILSSASLLMAQDITGKWRTFDDKTKQPKSIVQVSKVGDAYVGRILSVEAGVSPTCEDCTSSFKGKPLAGSTILTGLKDVGPNKYDSGRITNPKDGKTYKANAELTNNANTLHLRGYVGTSILGRTQIWQRVK
ncbi:DUF2147 domain-containing protein [Vitreoscilla stercoraria]|uniref:DUF2147 domain-containing protein n=1 Tax=Vitreoscilla stercoraria TaxID=61 RepID=A0ABY4EAC8_VITST|nr:DUF2147 domain-containing protein [Vitreoscilla stercoraria]UOO92345.1 DUF2147 domain-containing protein [Vitreoscilla stercoraria]